MLCNSVNKRTQILKMITKQQNDKKVLDTGNIVVSRKHKVKIVKNIRLMADMEHVLYVDGFGAITAKDFIKKYIRANVKEEDLRLLLNSNKDKPLWIKKLFTV